MMESGSTGSPLRAGTVSSVESQKKNPARVSVFIDGSFAFGLAADVAVTEGVRPGRILSVEDQERIRDAEGRSAARALALSYLSHRARTTEEVRQKLEGADFEVDVITAILHRLVELGYLDDEAYARGYAESRLARRFGPQRIVRELRRRGITSALAERAVAEAASVEDIVDKATTLARTRVARLANEKDVQRRRKKLYDFLVRRGYSSDVARSAVDAVQEEEWN